MDPFANLNWGGPAPASAQNSKPAQAHQPWRSTTPTPTSTGWRPQYGGSGFPGGPRMAASAGIGATATSAPRGSSGASTPTFGRPNYSRSAFEGMNFGGTVRPKVEENAFEDLLGTQGFSASSRTGSSSTLGALRREEEIKDLSEEQIKIRDWIKGKERNIRALLGSLDEIVWPECNWEPTPMSQLLNPAQIKKAYRKACLAVHPDKQTGQPHEALAKAIFTELNDAWNDFEKAGQPAM